MSTLIIQEQVAQTPLNILNDDVSLEMEVAKGKAKKTPGQWHTLPIELCDKIWQFIGEVDMIGYVYMLSKTPIFRPSQSIYRHFCETIYLSQTMKGQLIIENWRTWKRMLIHRPRLRTNGFYCLKTLYSRAPNNDAFWEEKRTQSVEVMYYRYMRFFNDGRVLYALNTTHPTEMMKQLKSGLPVDKKIYIGYYTLRGRQLDVEVRLHYCNMFFTLTLLDADDGWVGKHNMLTLQQHACSSLNTNTPGLSDQRILFHNNYETSNFYFWRQWYW